MTTIRWDSNGSMKEYYAHSLPNKPPEDWQRLEEHLKNVAEMAKGLAESFGAGEWAYLAGLLNHCGTGPFLDPDLRRGDGLLVEPLWH